MYLLNPEDKQNKYPFFWGWDHKFKSSITHNTPTTCTHSFHLLSLCLELAPFSSFVAQNLFFSAERLFRKWPIAQTGHQREKQRMLGYNSRQFRHFFKEEVKSSSIFCIVLSIEERSNRNLVGIRGQVNCKGKSNCYVEKREWVFTMWKQRYIDHPFIAAIDFPSRPVVI